MPIVIITNESPGVCSEGCYSKTRMYDTLLSFYTRHQNRIPQSRVDASLTAHSSPPDCLRENPLVKLSAVPINPVILSSMESSIENVRLKWMKHYKSRQVKQHLLERMLEEQERIVCKLISLGASIVEDISKFKTNHLARNLNGDPFQRTGSHGKKRAPSSSSIPQFVQVERGAGLSFPRSNDPIWERHSLFDLRSFLVTLKPFNKSNSYKYRGRQSSATPPEKCSVIHFLHDHPRTQLPLNSLWMKWVSLLNLLSCKLGHLFQSNLSQFRPVDTIILLIRTTMRRVRFLYEKSPAILTI